MPNISRVACGLPKRITSTTTLEIYSEQVTKGGGARNCLSWAMKAIELGFTDMILWVTSKAPINVIEQLQDVVDTINSSFPEFHVELIQGEPDFI